MKQSGSSVYYIIREMVMTVMVYKCLHLLIEKKQTLANKKPLNSEPNTMQSWRKFAANFKME